MPTTPTIQEQVMALQVSDACRVQVAAIVEHPGLVEPPSRIAAGYGPAEIFWEPLGLRVRVTPEGRIHDMSVPQPERALVRDVDYVVARVAAALEGT